MRHQVSYYFSNFLSAPDVHNLNINPDVAYVNIVQLIFLYAQATQTHGGLNLAKCSNFSGWHLMKSLAASEKHGLSRYVAHQAPEADRRHRCTQCGPTLS